MNNALIGNINESVDADDTLYLLGDVAMGEIHKSLEMFRWINCRNLMLVSGNHDRCWKHWPHKNDYQRLRWRVAYEEVGFTILPEQTDVTLSNGQIVTLCHFPYEGDSHDEDRYREYRPMYTGYDTPLLHGHIHTNERARPKNQYHVGVDGNFCKPVNESVIIDWLGTL